MMPIDLQEKKYTFIAAFGKAENICRSIRHLTKSDPQAEDDPYNGIRPHNALPNFHFNLN